MNFLPLPNDWHRQKIGLLCEPIRSVYPQRKGDGEFQYVDITSVSSVEKEIKETQVITNTAAPSRARQEIAYNDVIVSTVRPNLNAVALVPEALSNQICSTGFCVLRAKPDLLDPEYLFYWVQFPPFVQLLTSKARGIGYPAVSDSDVKNSQIPLPPLSEQRRIAAILREADGLRRLRRRADERARDLLPALFQEMFSQRREGWRERRLGDLFSLEAGRSIAAEAQPARDGEWGILKVSAVTSGTFRPEENKKLPDAMTPLAQFEVGEEELLISRANTEELIGASAITRNSPGQLLLPDKLWRVILPQEPETNIYFLYALLNTRDLRRAISMRSTGTSASMKNISQEKFLDIKILLPPKTLQDDFAVNARAIWDIVIDQQLESVQSIENLFQSLLARAFDGELTAAWREQHAELLHDEAVQRDIALGLRAAEPTLDDLEADRVTRAEREEAQRQIQQELQKLSQTMPSALLSLFGDSLSSLASQSLDSMIAGAIQPIEWDKLVVGMPEGLRLEATHITDNVRAIQQQALALPALQQSPEIAAQMVSSIGQFFQLYQRAQVIAGNRAVREAFDQRLNTLIDAIAQAPAYFRAEDLAQKDIGIGAADETLRVLAALGYVRPVLVRGQARYRRIDPVGERVVVEEFAG
jgi:type I restriction enzyme S subunit